MELSGATPEPKASAQMPSAAEHVSKNHPQTAMQTTPLDPLAQLPLTGVWASPTDIRASMLEPYRWLFCQGEEASCHCPDGGMDGA